MTDLARHVAALRERSPFYRDKLAGDRGRAVRGAAVHDEGRDPRVAGRRAAARPSPRGAARGRAAHLLEQRHHRRPVLHRGHRRPTSTAGPRSARAPTPRPGSSPSQRAVLTYNSARSWPARCSTPGPASARPTIPVGSGNTERLVRAFQVLGAEALGCTPSYALYLADWCRERGIEPRELGVRLFSVAGEPGGGEDATRHAIEEAFGATVREAMGIADVSPSLWGECEEQAGMHFCGRGPRPRRADRPGVRRAAPVRGSAPRASSSTRRCAARRCRCCASAAATASWSTRAECSCGRGGSACAASAAPTTS